MYDRQGEVWAMLRNKLTPVLTSPKTIKRFLPEVNQLADDFNSLIAESRDNDNVVKEFESYCNRMGLESTYNYRDVVRTNRLDNRFVLNIRRYVHPDFRQAVRIFGRRNKRYGKASGGLGN